MKITRKHVGMMAESDVDRGDGVMVAGRVVGVGPVRLFGMRTVEVMIADGVRPDSGYLVTQGRVVRVWHAPEAGA